MVPEVLQEVILKAEPREAKPAVVIQNLGDGQVLDQTRAALIEGTRPDILELAEALGHRVVRHGVYWATNCFFHHDPGPSMILYTSDNSFHCYGCEAHGDSLNLLARKDMTGRGFI